MQLSELREWLDALLRPDQVPDYPNALNGLQVENSGRVDRIAAAVDATQATIDAAAKAGANLLLVHHGLFWDGNQPLAGRRFRRVRSLIAADLAVYSAHLPLDVHPEVGNNAVLARALGIELRGNFGDYQGYPLGVWGEVGSGENGAGLSREGLAARLDATLGGRVHLVPGGPERVRRVGIITGGAGSMLGAARAAGLEAFITGEASHPTFFDAEEGGINLYLGGHYATETWGVRALAERIEQQWGIPWVWLHHPTGL